MRLALALELGTHTPNLLGRAEMFTAIAEDYGVTNEELIQWIHFPALGKRWATSEFVRWCQKYAAARREFEQLQRSEKAEWGKICTRCWGAVAERVGPRWICSQCGRWSEGSSPPRLHGAQFRYRWSFRAPSRAGYHAIAEPQKVRFRYDIMSQPTVLSDEWMDREEVIKLLGKSQSTIERLVASGDIKTTLKPVPHRKPLRLYWREDIERLTQEIARRDQRAVVRKARAPRSRPPRLSRCPSRSYRRPPRARFGSRLKKRPLCWD